MGTKEKCYFWRTNVGGDFCVATIYENCDPVTCPFYKTHRMYDLSVEKARRNFIKRYGYDGYGKFPYRQNYQTEARRRARFCVKGFISSGTYQSFCDRAADARNEQFSDGHKAGHLNATSRGGRD